MSHNLKLGKKGEEIAAHFLSSKGYEILETNWRSGRFEVDLIANKTNQLIIVEVKTRSNTKFGFPEESIGKRKQSFLAQAADEYVHQTNYDGEVRFDIVSILVSNDQEEILHIEDAFFPSDIN